MQSSVPPGPGLENTDLQKPLNQGNVDKCLVSSLEERDNIGHSESKYKLKL